MAKKISVKGPIVGNDIGWVYHYFGWDCCCPNDVAAGLKEANGEDVILEINSPGGFCDMGSEIYTVLMEYEGKVTAHIMSAASAASVIACAADEVLMSDTAVYMIHNSRGSGSGDYRDLMNVSEALEKYNESIVNAYVRKTGKSREELHAMMDHTTWMSASDTIEHGFADGYLFGDPAEEKGREGPEDRADEEQPAENRKERVSSPGGCQPSGGCHQAAAVAQAFTIPIISSEKALELRSIIELHGSAEKDFDSRKGKEALKELLIKNSDSDFFPENMEGIKAEIRGNLQNDSSITDSDRVTENNALQTEGGKEIMDENMSLSDFLEKNPEAKKEYQADLEAAGAEGVEAGIAQENARLKQLDAVSASVPADKLEKAKYGDKPVDAKEFVYQLFVEDGKKAAGYMANVIQDAKDANVDDVGSNAVDPDKTVDESDAYAAYINDRHAGRQS